MTPFVLLRVNSLISCEFKLSVANVSHSCLVFICLIGLLILDSHFR